MKPKVIWITKPQAEADGWLIGSTVSKQKTGQLDIRYLLDEWILIEDRLPEMPGYAAKHYWVFRECGFAQEAAFEGFELIEEKS